MTEQNHEPLGAAELEAIAERCERATKGPWQKRSRTKWGAERIWSATDNQIATMTDRQGEPTRANADFIAHAREDVARLLADLRTAREETRLANAQAQQANTKHAQVEDILAGLLCDMHYDAAWAGERGTGTCVWCELEDKPCES